MRVVKTMRGGQSSPSPPDARASGSGYDAAANRFDLLRPLPDGATQGIRLAVIRAVGSVTRPHLLDLGAGAGRIGRTFVAAGDDYLGVDLSFSMLGAFQRSSPHRTPWPARLVQADGRTLPFRDATFDAVMMMQVFGGMSAWPAVLTETRRVLRSSGALILGRTLTPQDGVDAILKRRLASMLSDLGFDEGHNFRRDVERALEVDCAQRRVRCCGLVAGRKHGAPVSGAAANGRPIFGAAPIHQGRRSAAAWGLGRHRDRLARCRSFRATRL